MTYPMTSKYVYHEGTLLRKHEWETVDKKSVKRSWLDVFVVLEDDSISCYKDAKHKMERINKEAPISLDGARCEKALDYSKRPYVLRITLETGGEYLFQAKDATERDSWIEQIKNNIKAQHRLV